jgi:hypothetical protein
MQCAVVLQLSSQAPLLMQFGETDNFFDANEARKVAESIKVMMIKL